MQGGFVLAQLKRGGKYVLVFIFSCACSRVTCQVIGDLRMARTFVCEMHWAVETRNSNTGLMVHIPQPTWVF